MGLKAVYLHLTSLIIVEITIAADAMTGTLDIASLEVSGAGAITVTTGTAGNFSAATVNAAAALLLMVRRTPLVLGQLLLPHSLLVAPLSISLGSGSGDFTINY